MKKLDYYVACSKCKIKCVIVEDGILCPKCEAFISDEDLGYE